jgi:5-methylcytosine-specific restriction enzyme A
MKFYNQEVDISTDFWKEILQDKEISTDKVVQILSFLFNSDGYESSGGIIAFALNYEHHVILNKIISDFAKRILKKYPHIEPPTRDSGKIRYWHIPFLGTEGKGNFIWILRPELIEALPHVFQNIKNEKRPNILQEIEQFKYSYEALQETTRESVIQSRIGQGQFRISLIGYWHGCSVSGCEQVEILKRPTLNPGAIQQTKKGLMFSMAYCFFPTWTPVLIWDL